MSLVAFYRHFLILTVAVILIGSYNATEVNRNFLTHLTRRKRFFIFPKAAGVGVAIAVAKRVITPSPTSTNIVVTFATGYGLPTKIDDLRPKFLHRRKKKPDKGKDQPSSPSPPIETVEHIVESLPPSIAHTSNKWSSKPSYEEIASHHPVITSAWKGNMQSNISRNDYFRLKPLEHTIPVYDEWIDHSPHRERRNFFSGLENAAHRFGYSIKDCILRTICEVKHFLLPPGKSLIQDIIRAIFRIPAKDHWKDEYSHATRLNSTDCKNVYKERCPISILELALHNQVDISKL